MEGGGPDPLDPLEGPHTTGGTSATEQRRSWVAANQVGSWAGIGAVAVIAIVLSIVLDNKIADTIATVVIAVAACGGIWVGANLLFDQARERWQRFQTLWFGVIGAIAGIILHGNGLTLGSGDNALAWFLGPLVGGVAFGALGFVLAVTDDPSRRMALSVGGFAVAGVAVGLLLREEYQPGVDWAATAI